MQKVQLKQSKLNLEQTLATGKAVYDETVTNHLVASTKSLNILLRECKEKNIDIKEIKTANVWANREVVYMHLVVLASDLYKNDKEMQDMFVDYMQAQLEKACIYEK